MKGEDIGASRNGKQELLCVCGGGDWGSRSTPRKPLWVLHCASGPGPASSTAQCGQSFPRERLPGIGKEGKLRTGGGGRDKGTLIGGGKKRVRKEKEVMGKGNKLVGSSEMPPVGPLYVCTLVDTHTI